MEYVRRVKKKVGYDLVWSSWFGGVSAWSRGVERPAHLDWCGPDGVPLYRFRDMDVVGYRSLAKRLACSQVAVVTFE